MMAGRAKILMVADPVIPVAKDIKNRALKCAQHVEYLAGGVCPDVPGDD